MRAWVRTVLLTACLAAFLPSAWGQDLPPPRVIGGPPTYPATSIARRPDEPAPSTWTTPPSTALSAQDLQIVPASAFVPAAAGATPAPRFARRVYRPYDITSGAYRPRGPVEIRDEWLLAQPKMTLPGMSPDPVPVGQWRLHFYINRGNDFGFDQTGPAEMPIDRRFLVDGEHQTTAVDARVGVLPRLALGVRLPVHWRGGGFMDSIIDAFHDVTKGLGTLDNARPAFDKDKYRVEGRDAAFNAISWNDKRGTGLGRLEVQAYWNVLQPCRRCDWRAAIVARIGLPTGTAPFDAGGVDVGLQAIVAKQFGRRFDLYGGVGGTWFSDTELDGILYEDFRGWLFGAAEWHVGRTLSLVLQVDGASRLVTNLADYPALSSYVHLSGRWDVSRCLELEAGFTENIADQQGTVDVGVFGGFTWRF